MNYKKPYWSIALLTFCLACSNSGNDTPIQTIDTTAMAQKKLEMSSDAINEVIKSIPSPLELTSLIKESGAEFNKSMLNNTENKDAYTQTFSKAVNLGIYGADLGYINIYEKSSASLEYLSTIRGLADDLYLGQFFDFETLKRLASNSSKLDSLIFISTMSFEKMNNYLAKQKRDNVSVLMLIGGWIESLHLAALVAKETKSVQLMERVGEQKISLDQIQILLKLFKDDKAFAPLNDEMDKLKNLYDQVKITYEYKEPVTKEVNGMLVVEENSGSTSSISISQSLFDQIANQIAKIRSTLIKVN